MAGVSGGIGRSSGPFALWDFGRAFDFCFFGGIIFFLFIVPPSIDRGNRYQEGPPASCGAERLLRAFSGAEKQIAPVNNKKNGSLEKRSQINRLIAGEGFRVGRI